MGSKLYSSKIFQNQAKDIAFDELFDLLPINFSWMDSNGYILGCNEELLKTQNIDSPDDIIGKHTEKVCNGSAWENTQKVIKNGKTLIVDEEHQKSDGTSIYFLSIKSPIYDLDNDKVIGVVNVALDITERKLLEKELEKEKAALELANMIKTEFLGNMRHDLRTPFNGIISISEFLERNELDPDKKKCLEEIKKSSQSLLAYLNEILEYVKIENGQRPIIEKEFDLLAVLEDVFNMMLPSANGKKLDFRYFIEKNVPVTFIGDSSRTQRILMNIVSNAIKFTEKGHVHVFVNWTVKSSEKGVIQFIIDDTGIGIPEDKKEIIFERFHRLEASYKNNYEGSGLGFTIVKQFLEELGGQYNLESVLGKGTVFKVLIPFKIPLLSQMDIAYLPLKDMAVCMDKTEITAENSNNNRILLVEDYEMIAKVSKSIFEELQCKVDIAMNGKEALELSTKNEYDLILLDIGLPDIDGYTIAKQIRENKNPLIAKTPIVALTGHLEAEERKICIDAGMDEMASKPLTYELAKSLCKYLKFSPYLK